ncbi:MAG: arginine--tRNA ligase [Candidatus Levybacteria bacterium RIFCSPLOWO2_01_FULL_39_10]|nr:MAG: arginine--tRNA ligase [Candidatus Levybacteria bacterium RIFCSPLOWO2_01_FULL_39_10]
MELGQQLAISLQQLVKELTGYEIEPRVEIPGDLSKGDLTTNVAMTTFVKVKSPMELAEEIKKKLLEDKELSSKFEKIEVIPPGFINFFLKEEIIDSLINSLIQNLSSKPKKTSKPTFAKASAGKQIIFEFGDPNPFKEPHIGHLRNLVLGESISRLLEDQGNEVIRANYQGDVGLHVAKAIYGLLQISNFSFDPELRTEGQFPISNLEKGSLENKAKFLGEAYALGAEKFESDENAKQEIISINNKIYSAFAKASADKSADKQNDTEIYSLWQKGRSISLDHFEELYKVLGIKYKNYYFESETAPIGLEIVENNPEVFEKHEGAYIFRGENEGLHTRVFVTKAGFATYEGKDLALAHLKEKDYPDFDKSIIMTANEQIDYFKVLLAALEKVNKKIAEKTSHLSFGFVNLKEEKMSSRLGNIVSSFWLLEETEKRLKEGHKDVKNEVLDDITVGAVKWSMLKFSRDSDISFSIDESIDLEGNSGPYIQYSYARINSILTKKNKKDFKATPLKNLEAEDIALARLICQYEFFKNKAAGNLSPNILCNYLFQLSQQFNKFYEKEKVLGSMKEEERLRLVIATGLVIKHGLYLLGIEALDRI